MSMVRCSSLSNSQASLATSKRSSRWYSARYFTDRCSSESQLPNYCYARSLGLKRGHAYDPIAHISAVHDLTCGTIPHVVTLKASEKLDSQCFQKGLCQEPVHLTRLESAAVLFASVGCRSPLAIGYPPPRGGWGGGGAVHLGGRLGVPI
jgi:hypothetical protein